MKISIITPMYNSANYISRMVEAVNNLDYPKDLIEIIIIDNGSDDNSVDIVKNMNVRCTVMKGVSISQMRNAGASMATGEVLGFVDSDCIVNSDWAKKAIEFISGDVGIVGGYYGLGDSPGWIEKTWYELKKDVSGDVSFVSAGNMVIKAALFHEVNGFDENLETGEDWDFCQRVIEAGYKVTNQPSLSVKHLGNHKTLLGIIKKERWYGQGMFDVLKGNRLSKPLLASILFLVLLLTVVVSLLTGNISITIASLLAIALLVLLMAFHFTRNVMHNKLLIFIKCIPISFSYVIGRSLSVLDQVVKRITPSAP